MLHHSRSPSRSSVLISATALLALVLLAPVRAQSPRAYWIAPKGTAPVSQTVMTRVRAVIGATYDLSEPATDLAVTGVESTLRQLRSVSARDVVFLAVDHATLTEVLRREPGIISMLGLEPMNVGVSAAPFYLFAQAATADSLRGQAGVSRRILYVDKLGMLQPVDVAALLDPLLRTRAVVVGPLESPRELARRLLNGATDIVGIYDDDPSTFRDDFITSYEELRPRGDSARLQALKMVVFPADDADYRDRSVGISQTGLSYAIVRYDDVAFGDLPTLAPVAGADRVVALSRTSPAADANLLLLTNVKTLVGEAEAQRVRRMLSYAHLAAIYRADPGPLRCAAASRTSYRLFLLNAYLADRQDVVKSLAIWSDLRLALNVTKGGEQSQIRSEIDLVNAILARQQNFHVDNKDDWKALAARLSAGATVREQFSGQDATLYRQALDAIKAAASETGPASRRRLEDARRKLVELIRKGVGPACIVGGSEGLFNTSEFDPFFYLGMIEAQLAIGTAATR